MCVTSERVLVGVLICDAWLSLPLLIFLEEVCSRWSTTSCLMHAKRRKTVASSPFQITVRSPPCLTLSAILSYSIKCISLFRQNKKKLSLTLVFAVGWWPGYKFWFSKSEFCTISGRVVRVARTSDLRRQVRSCRLVITSGCRELPCRRKKRANI